MRGCDVNVECNDRDLDNKDEITKSDDDDCVDDDGNGSSDGGGIGDGDGGGVGDCDGRATDNNQLKLQKWWQLQLGNSWATASQHQRQGCRWQRR